MNVLTIFIAATIGTAFLTLINPFLVLPVFIFGIFLEPMKYFPELLQYRPATVIGVVVMIAWIIHASICKDVVRQRNKQVTVAYIFIFWAALSCWFNKDTSWQFFLGYLRAFIPFFLFVYIINSRKQLSVIIWTLLIFGAVAAIYGIYCLKANIGWSAGGYKRIAGFFTNPDMFGEASALLIPFALAQLFSNYTRSIKLALWCILILLVTGTVISFSRAALFALLLGIFLVPFKLFSGERKIIALLTTIMLALAAFYVFPDGAKYRMWARVRNIFQADSAEELDLGRVMTIRAGIRMMKEHPFIGVGLGGFKPEYKRLADANPDIVLVRGNKITGSEVMVAHNVIIEAGSMLGIIGLAIYLLFVFYAWANAKKAEKIFADANDDHLRHLSIAMQVFVLEAIFTGQLTPFLTSKIFWMVTALSAVIMRQANTIPEQDKQELLNQGIPKNFQGLPKDYSQHDFL